MQPALPDSDPNERLIFLGVGATVYVLLIGVAFRVYPPLGMALLVVAIVAGVAYGIRQLLRSRQRSKDLKRMESSFAHRIATRLAECRQHEARFRAEGEDIMGGIRTLREDLDRSAGAEPTERQRAAEVITELEAEFSLRHAKATFFADCASRLQKLLDRHRLIESIAARRQELDAMRQHNFDDEATAEETRYHLQQDSIQLDTIVELGRNVASTFGAEQAAEIRDRLEKLRTSLDDK